MSQFTMELRRVCEALVGYTRPEEYPEIDSLISKARPLIFDFKYPIFDESYREVIETKIIQTYFFREICDVPVARWKMFLKQTMFNIMPYYNKLYESEQLAFNPLFTVDYKRDYTRNQDKTENGESLENINGNTEINSTTDQNNTVIRNESLAHSDTPQGSLQKLSEGTYMSSGDINTYTTTDSGKTTASSNTDNTQTNKINNTQKANTTEGYVENITGKNDSKSYSQLIMEYRDSLLNIDMMLIEELKTLFFPIMQDY